MQLWKGFRIYSKWKRQVKIIDRMAFYKDKKVDAKMYWKCENYKEVKCVRMLVILYILYIFQQMYFQLIVLRWKLHKHIK